MLRGKDRGEKTLLQALRSSDARRSETSEASVMDHREKAAGFADQRLCLSGMSSRISEGIDISRYRSHVVSMLYRCEEVPCCDEKIPLKGEGENSGLHYFIVP